MSAAFNTVDHIILLNKLFKCFSINNIAVPWLKSYLFNRGQCVSVNNCLSEPCLLSSGVPQGSVLTPLLFTLYMKPLASLISNFGFGYHFYADDVTFNHTNAFNASVIANCLKVVEQWPSLNKLKLNPSKTQCMLFSCKQSVSNVLDDDKSLVMSHNSVKKLGVILDCSLSLEEQIRSLLLKKIFSYLQHWKNLYIQSNLGYRTLLFMTKSVFELKIRF